MSFARFIACKLQLACFFFFVYLISRIVAEQPRNVVWRHFVKTHFTSHYYYFSCLLRVRVVSPIPLAKKQNANLKSFRHRPQLGHPLRQYTVGKNLTKLNLRAKRAIAGGLIMTRKGNQIPIDTKSWFTSSKKIRNSGTFCNPIFDQFSNPIFKAQGDKNKLA